MSKYTRTGVTVDCPCGAEGVPMAWGLGNGSVRLYKHDNPAGDRCGGPADLFTMMLRDARMALAGRGERLATRSERAERDMQEARA